MRVRRSRSPFVIACALFCAQLAIVGAEARTFLSDYAPLLSAPSVPIRIEVFTPLHSYCRRGGNVTNTRVPNVVTTREITIKLVMRSPLPVERLETIADKSWSEQTARLYRHYWPKSGRALRDQPPPFPHLAGHRTLNLSANPTDGGTQLIHQSHIRICPAGTF
jgi:hypothetical protein